MKWRLIWLLLLGWLIIGGSQHGRRSQNVSQPVVASTAVLPVPLVAQDLPEQSEQVEPYPIATFDPAEKEMVLIRPPKVVYTPEARAMKLPFMLGRSSGTSLPVVSTTDQYAAIEKHDDGPDTKLSNFNAGVLWHNKPTDSQSKFSAGTHHLVLTITSQENRRTYTHELTLIVTTDKTLPSTLAFPLQNRQLALGQTFGLFLQDDAGHYYCPAYIAKALDPKKDAPPNMIKDFAYITGIAGTTVTFGTDADNSNNGEPYKLVYSGTNEIRQLSSDTAPQLQLPIHYQPAAGVHFSAEWTLTPAVLDTFSSTADFIQLPAIVGSFNGTYFVKLSYGGESKSDLTTTGEFKVTNTAMNTASLAENQVVALKQLWSTQQQITLSRPFIVILKRGQQLLVNVSPFMGAGNEIPIEYRLTPDGSAISGGQHLTMPFKPLNSGDQYAMIKAAPELSVPPTNTAITGAYSGQVTYTVTG